MKGLSPFRDTWDQFADGKVQRQIPVGAELSKARSITAIVAGTVFLVVAAAALVARYSEIPGHRTLYVVVASPYLLPAGVAAVLVFVWGRRWVLTAIACCLLAALVIPQLPWYFRTPDDDADKVAFRVMTSNMLYGEADADALVATAQANADVVMLQELTPDAVGRLTAAGMDESFPYHALDARPKAAGVGIYSRLPLENITRVPGFNLAMVSAKVRVEGTAHDTSILTVHLDAPWPRPIDGWHQDFGKLPQTLDDLAKQSNGAPVVVGGDFNATIDMRPFRDLLTNGYRDAAEQAGAGRELTYPANTEYPPVMGIDHFLTRDCIADSTRTVTITGSDHRGVVATIMIPRG